jgi:hypothetical protein
LGIGSALQLYRAPQSRSWSHLISSSSNGCYRQVKTRWHVNAPFFFFYSYVHTMFGSFLFPFPTPPLPTPRPPASPLLLNAPFINCKFKVRDSTLSNCDGCLSKTWTEKHCMTAPYLDTPYYTTSLIPRDRDNLTFNT